MSGAVLLPDGGVAISARASASLGPGLTRLLEMAKREGQRVHPDVVEAIELVDRSGAAWSALRERAVSKPAPPDRETSEFHAIDDCGFTAVEWVTVGSVAKQLGVTGQMVCRKLKRGDLHGEQDRDRGPWRVCSDSVRAYHRGERCSH